MMILRKPTWMMMIVNGDDLEKDNVDDDDVAIVKKTLQEKGVMT